MSLKYISEFRNLQAAQALSKQIHIEAKKLESKLKSLQIMEVCGGHTVSIFKYGIRDLMPPWIRLVSGPGCPVCVTANDFLDTAIAMAAKPNVILTTFGDLIRVPGSYSSLREEKAKDRDIRICYSPLDALEIAKKNPNHEVVFLGIGFETTAPIVAATILRAQAESVRNFSVLSAFKTMPQAMKALLSSGELKIHAFICPGHVSVVTGLKMYEEICKEFHTPCVVSGFEPLDLLQSVLMILRQLSMKELKVENQYTRAATVEGNVKAQETISEVFAPSDVLWRGIGIIPESGLKISRRYSEFDAAIRIPVKINPVKENPACICGAIMRGVKEPTQCPLFMKVCTPENPKGSCMVSEEGTCGTYYKYHSFER